MAAAGAQEGAKTRRGTDQALRNARREAKIFQINKEREVARRLAHIESAGEAELDAAARRLASGREELREAHARCALLRKRILVLEKKLAHEGLANGEMR